MDCFVAPLLAMTRRTDSVRVDKSLGMSLDTLLEGCIRVKSTLFLLAPALALSAPVTAQAPAPGKAWSPAQAQAILAKSSALVNALPLR